MPMSTRPVDNLTACTEYILYYTALYTHCDRIHTQRVPFSTRSVPLTICTVHLASVPLTKCVTRTLRRVAAEHSIFALRQHSIFALHPCSLPPTAGAGPSSRTHRVRGAVATIPYSSCLEALL